MENSSVKVDIIGTYPEPVGGTSIHVKRLFERCLEAGYDVILYDTHAREGKKYISNRIKAISNYKKFIIKYMLEKRADIIHCHSHSWVERYFLTVKAKLRGQKIIFTFHSFRDEYHELSYKQKEASKFVLKTADKFIVPNNDLKKKLVSWGCDESKISVITTFIAPKMTSSKLLNQNIKLFMEKFKYTILANASNNDHFKDEDMYGMDMCVNLLGKLSKSYDIGCVYVLTKVTDQEYLNDINKQIKDKNLTEKILVFVGNVDLLPLLRKASIFVRPTNTDSWAMSVSESILVGTPAIASNVCKRQDGVIWFESRNQTDFEKKVEFCLNDLERQKNILQGKDINDGYEKIIEEYMLIRK